MHPETRPAPRLPFVLAIPVLVGCAAAGLVAALTATERRIRPAPASIALAWSARRAEVEARLTANPKDLAAELKLSGILSKQAEAEAQERFGQAPRSRRGSYREFMAARLGRSQEVVDAEALDRHVAATAPDPHLRARAWAHLAALNRALGNGQEQMRCMVEAARQDPAQFEGTLRAWTARGAR